MNISTMNNFKRKTVLKNQFESFNKYLKEFKQKLHALQVENKTKLFLNLTADFFIHIS